MSQGNSASALLDFRQLLERSPEYELAWIRIADLYASGDLSDVEKESRLWFEIQRRFPASLLATSRQLKTLRLQGRSSEAIALLDSAISKESTTAPRWLGSIDPLTRVDLKLDATRFTDAIQELEVLRLNEPSGFRSGLDRMFQAKLDASNVDSSDLVHGIQTASLALSLGNQQARSEKIRDEHIERVARIRRLMDLRTMKQIAPNGLGIDQAILEAEDTQSQFASSVLSRGKTKPGSTSALNPKETQGVALYQKHCASCHGVQGDGIGPASRHLSPAARNFTREPMRYVSGANSLANDLDIATTIRKGLEGVSMPGFRQFAEQEIETLVQQVRRFQREGHRIKFRRQNATIASAATNVESNQLKAVEQENALIESRMQGGPTIPDVELLSSTESRRKVGEEVFSRLGCIQCHRTSAESSIRLFGDSMGRTLRARDFITEPMRRGNDRQEIYRRIVLGMPGTPHPALASSLDLASPLDIEQISALICFVQSLVPTNLQPTTNYERARSNAFNAKPVEQKQSR